jgi:hypothetical protein
MLTGAPNKGGEGGGGGGERARAFNRDPLNQNTNTGMCENETFHLEMERARDHNPVRDRDFEGRHVFKCAKPRSWARDSEERERKRDRALSGMIHKE